jgi:hypothetical protein
VPAPEKRGDLFPQMDNCRLTLEAARIGVKPEGACEEPVDLPILLLQTGPIIHALSPAQVNVKLR